MSSLSFKDPISGKTVEVRRNLRNPFYARLRKFRDTPPTSLFFIADGTGQIAKNAYVFPADFPLAAVPAIKLQLVPVAKGARYEVHGRLGFFNQASQAAFPSHQLLHFDWIGDVWKKHLALLLYDDLYCRYLKYLDVKGRLPEFDSKSDSSGTLNFVAEPERASHPYSGRSDPAEAEFPHLLYLKVCLAWPHWEAEKTPWKTRTAQAITLGICRAMDEDNFRKICKRAGLLVPRTALLKAELPKAARKRS